MGANTRKCSKCQKEISSGKFFNFFAGQKGKKSLFRYVIKGKENSFFCPSCADQEKASPVFWSSEDLIKVEWKIGNKTDEEILAFEKKWQVYSYDMACRMPGGLIGESGFNLDFVRKVKQKLEPYLQKPEVVEKSFGGKIKDCGTIRLEFCFFLLNRLATKNIAKR